MKRGYRTWALACLLVLLASCAAPARYVIVTGRSDVDFSDGNQRFICISAADAMNLSGMVALRNDRDINRYGKGRSSASGPLEAILFQMIRNDYAAAGALLERDGRRVPEDLRLLLAADILYETAADIPRERLTRLYQEAFEKQSCDLNKDLIVLRIRQLRYGR